jgi:hypothetical protein
MSGKDGRWLTQERPYRFLNTKINGQKIKKPLGFAAMPKNSWRIQRSERGLPEKNAGPLSANSPDSAKSRCCKGTVSSVESLPSRDPAKATQKFDDRRNRLESM